MRGHRAAATLEPNHSAGLPMYYIALLVAVLSFMAVIASLDPAQRRQSRIARRQRD